MADPGGHPDYGGSGMRRRQSAQHESTDLRPAERTTGVLSTSTTNASASDAAPSNAPSEPSTSTLASGVDSHIASPTEHAPRVRFSTDVDRQTPTPAVPVGSSHDHTRALGSSTTKDYVQPKKRPGTPDLSLDTTVPVNNGIRQSSQETVSPAGLRSTASPTSPLSPGSRSRGYSLRSALFRRNIEDTTSKPSAVIELKETEGSAAADSQEARVIGTPKASSAEATVSVAPILDVGQGGYSKGSKGLQGISALPHYETWIRSRAQRNGLLNAARTAYRGARKFVLRIQEIPPTKDGRHIDLDATRQEQLLDERTGKIYIGNTIRSTRFTVWNFLPRQLFAQFSKLANFYFLVISILQMIPGLSTTGTFTTFAPLMFFVGLSMAKEGYDDLRRHRLDKAENIREAKVMHASRTTKTEVLDKRSVASDSLDVAPLKWVDTKWKDLQVGDIIKLDRDEAAPADLVILRSSGANGIAYVETMALDGETNLKSKQATASVAGACTSEEEVANCRAHFVVEDPNLDLYKFEGKVTVNSETSPLTNNEIIYRGSILRNTPDAIGMVIYSGEECKIRMNANKNPRIKAPALQTLVNRIVIVIVIFVLALAIFNTVAYQLWDSTEDKSWYLENASVAFFPILTSFIIMFNTMIPLSLYVSLEIVKLAQMYFFNDIDMYDPESNVPCEARTSTINEELGQVRYAFVVALGFHSS